MLIPVKPGEFIAEPFCYKPEKRFIHEVHEGSQIKPANLLVLLLNPGKAAQPDTDNEGKRAERRSFYNR